MIILNKNTDKRILDHLSKFDEILLLPALSQIKDSVAEHIDLACVQISKYLIVAPELKKFMPKNSQVIFGEKNPQNGYPNDILYNAAIIGNKIFCKSENTDKTVLKIAEENNITIIDTNQGYAKCNIVKISDSAIITEDMDIHKKAITNDINSLLIKKGEVKLRGYKYGFLGGASLFFGEKIIFFGDIRKHHDYLEISEFCNNHNKEIDFIADIQLTDIGSPVYFPNI